MVMVDAVEICKLDLDSNLKSELVGVEMKISMLYQEIVRNVA